MEAFVSFAYPAYLFACGVLAIAGALSAATVRMHKTLQWVVTGFYVVTVIAVGMGVIGLFSGGDVVLLLGYLLAQLGILLLLGIGRLGDPEAAKHDPDPTRPILSPRQIARVDGGAALIVAVAGAVLAWRIATIAGAS
jgi:hypothetical protein